MAERKIKSDEVANIITRPTCNTDDKSSSGVVSSLPFHQLLVQQSLPERVVMKMSQLIKSTDTTSKQDANACDVNWQKRNNLDLFQTCVKR